MIKSPSASIQTTRVNFSHAFFRYISDVLYNHLLTIMLCISFFILIESIGILMGDISFEINHIKERLETVAHLSSLTELVKIPKASFYLNSHLTQNHPHRIDLTNQLTSIIPEWTPDILASDPTCPYYFSKIIHSSSSNTDRNLLAYLQASLLLEK